MGTLFFLGGAGLFASKCWYVVPFFGLEGGRFPCQINLGTLFVLGGRVPSQANLGTLFFFGGGRAPLQANVGTLFFGCAARPFTSKCGYVVCFGGGGAGSFASKCRYVVLSAEVG